MSMERAVGIDWGSRKHQVCRITNGIEEQRGFDHSGGGIEELIRFVLDGTNERERIVVGIEVNHGPLLEALLARGIEVYSINPKQVDRMRDRLSVSGSKDDRRDARVLARGLLTGLASYVRVEIEEEERITRLRRPEASPRA